MVLKDKLIFFFSLKAETIGTVFIRRQMLAVSFKYSYSSTEV
jgi:hypothetical protein